MGIRSTPVTRTSLPDLKPFPAKSCLKGSLLNLTIGILLLLITVGNMTAFANSGDWSAQDVQFGSV